MKTLERLRKFKAKKNKTIRELSQDLDVTIQTIHRWLHGQVKKMHPIIEEKVISYLKANGG